MLSALRGQYASAVDDADARRASAQRELRALRERPEPGDRPERDALETQRAVEAAGRESRDATRMLTQVEKIYRLRQLARLEQALEQYGNAEERARYGELVQCEAGHLSP
jgi:hypothetical protein